MDTKSTLIVIGVVIILIGLLSLLIRTKIIVKMDYRYYKGKKEIDKTRAPNLYGGYTFDTQYSSMREFNPIGIEYGVTFPIIWSIVLFIATYLEPTTHNIVVTVIEVILIYVSMIIWVIGMVFRINLRRVAKPSITGRFYYMQNCESNAWLGYCMSLVGLDSLAFVMAGIIVLCHGCLF